MLRSVLAPLVLAAAPAFASDWPEWRGPTQQGHAPDARDLPLTWSETEHVAWKTPIPGRGHSSPVISGNRVWLTTAHESPADPEDAKRRLEANTGGQPLNLLAEVRLHAVCLDLDSGAVLHDVLLLTREKPQWVHQLNSYASPTPVLAEGKLFAHFGSYGTAAVDAATGSVLWTNQDEDLVVMHENGPGSSPVAWKDKLIFHLDGSDRQFLVALDTATGRVAWKTPRTGTLPENPQLRKSYGTPVLFPLPDGSAELLSPAANWLYAYDPATGRERWKTDYEGHLGFSNVSRPVFGHGLLYVPTCFMKSKLLAFRYDGSAPPELAWRIERSMPNQPSPLLVGDELYLCDDRGVATCADARSGEVLWQERLEGNVSASPLFADGKIFLSTQEGKTVVLAPGRTFRKLAENHLDGALMASPVAVGRSLFLRTDRALYRIELPSA
jgi:energy-converting hydrogenase Eha subunit A